MTRVPVLPVPNSSGTTRPRARAPKSACDSHIHIYDPRFPVKWQNLRAVENASVAEYKLLQERVGTTRTIVVQPAAYGTDNSVTLDAVAQLGLDNARGIAVAHPTVTDTELVAMADLIERLPGTLVFDHMGRMPQPEGIHHPAFNILRRLIDTGRVWVKLSGPYLDTKEGAPRYSDITPVGRALAGHAPERCVWGSDWPHPTEPNVKPDDAVLFDLVQEWTLDEVTRSRILVGNPAALYGF